MNTFSIVFIVALAATAATRLWLALRHVRHVQANRERVPAAFAADIDLQAHHKAADYTSAKTRLSATAIAFDTLVLLALTFGRVLQWLDGAAAGLFSNEILRGTAFVAMLVVLTSAIELPFGLYRTFVIEMRFGFNKMTFAMWLKDLIKHAVVGALLGLPLVLAVLWLMDRMGELWWLYVWVVWVAFNTLVLAIYPTFIAPLFNKFSPMQEGELKKRIEQLIERCGFTSKGLFVMDGSTRSTHGNAYFTGFGKSKRIVFFDTLLNRLDPPEIEAVLAHELGHFRLRHVVKRLAWTFAVSLVLLWVLGELRGQSWFFEGLGVAFPATDAMALALFFLVVPVFTFPLQPLMAMYSRKHEFEADEYAALFAPARDLTRALVKLYKDNASTLTPDPLHSAFYDSHPPAAVRIARLEQLTAKS
jgi:STE24 endopeptidase